MGILIGLERVGHEWPGKRVLEEQTIGINEGERIGIVGRNGDGKSTLLEIVGQALEPDSGTVTWRRGIAVGYLGQADELDDRDPVRRAIFGDVPEYTWASDARIRAILDELVGDLDLDGLVGELSGGQRRRADLCRVLCHTWDVILMDEPTNHLDLHSTEALERALAAYPGALVLVSHDRRFLSACTTRTWEVRDGLVREA